MLELVEIEVLRRDLEQEVAGRRIKEATVRPGRNAMKVVRNHGRRKEVEDLLVGAKVARARRAGKSLLLDLDSGNVLVLELGDAARVLKASTSEPMTPPTHLVVGFTIGGQLRLIDPKATSALWIAPAQETEAIEDGHGFLIDPLHHQFTWRYLATVLDERDTPLKQLLSDEGFICGLGDVYSDEVLWAAGLNYDHPSSKLTSQDVRRLYRALMETLQDAVKARGTSVGEHPFTDLLGNPGSYQAELKVYGREGLPCPRCRHEIEKVDYGPGVTYHCPQCQS